MRVASATTTSRRSLSTNDTVDCETPAARATSTIVGRRPATAPPLLGPTDAEPVTGSPPLRTQYVLTRYLAPPTFAQYVLGALDEEASVSGSPLALSRRSLLRAAGGLSLTALAGTAVGCAPGGASDKTLRVAYFGDQKAADELRDRLRGPVRELDPDIALEITAVNGTDWNNFLAKVLTQIAAGTPPDVIGVPTEGLQLIAEKDLVIPLDDYVRRDLPQLQPYFDDVHPALVEAMMYQGSLFILPVDFNAGNMYYNAGLFEQAQVPAPTADWTVDTFYDACTRIARLPDVAAFNWVVRLWGSWTSFLYANGGNLLEEGRYPGGEWLWTSAYAGNPAAAGRSGGYQWGRP